MPCCITGEIKNVTTATLVTLEVKSVAKPDWNAIRAEYLTSSISYRDLADKWGVSFRTLADHARKEKWAEGRTGYRNTVTKKTVQKVAAATAADNAGKLVRLQQAADSMSAVIADIFTDTEQFKRHIVPDGDSSVAERVYKKVDTKSIKDLTGALKDLACVMRNIYDLPTVAEQSAMELAAQRLELEKAKADVGRPDDEETGIVEITPVLEDKDDEQ